MIDVLVGWLTDWATTFVVWRPTGEEIAKVIAACAWLMTVVQAIKRAIEWVERNPMLARLLPRDLREALGKLAHGTGARILAAIVVVATLLPTVLMDGNVTLAEALNVVLGFLGTLLTYWAVRGRSGGFLFPKRDEKKNEARQ